MADYNDDDNEVDYNQSLPGTVEDKYGRVRLLTPDEQIKMLQNFAKQGTASFESPEDAQRYAKESADMRKNDIESALKDSELKQKEDGRWMLVNKKAGGWIPIADDELDEVRKRMEDNNQFNNLGQLTPEGNIENLNKLSVGDMLQNQTSPSSEYGVENLPEPLDPNREGSPFYKDQFNKIGRMMQKPGGFPKMNQLEQERTDYDQIIKNKRK